MKVNLLVDTNNLFYPGSGMKNFAKKIEKTFPKTEKILESVEEFEIFKEKINIDFKLILQFFSKIDKVYFLQDSSSWRKKVKINGKQFYKTNRDKKNDNIYWEHFQKGIDEFVLSDENYKQLRIRDLEADDLLYLVNQKLLEEPNVLNIIVSEDEDMHQLLGRRTIIYKNTYKHKKMIFAEGVTLDDIKNMEDYNTPSLFETKKENSLLDMFKVDDLEFHNDSNDTATPLWEKLKGKLDIEYTDALELTTLKIFTGDRKDTVPTAYSWEKIKTKKKKADPDEMITVNLTKKHILPLIEYLKDKDIKFNFKEILKNFDIVHEFLCEITKQNIDKEVMLTNIKRNIKVLYLSHKTIPITLIDKFEKEYRLL